jgi:hypothetical protein
MDYEVPKTETYRAVMTGLFVGIIDTLLCLFFNLFYRESTGFTPTAIVNVSSLIFFINLLLPLIGVLYSGFLSWFKKADIVFIIAIVVVTLFFVWRAESVTRGDNPTENSEFRTLLLGIVLILGLSSAFLIPYLFHNKKFEENVV